MHNILIIQSVAVIQQYKYWFAYKNGYTYKMKFSFSICHIFVLVGFVKLLMVMEGGYLPKKLLKNIKKKERESIEKINGPDTESESEKGSGSESISSCNAAEKRKFEDDELDKSDISSESLSYNGHVPLITKR